MAATDDSVDLLGLEPSKWMCLESILTTILASTAAEEIFAQVIEGRPTRLPDLVNYDFEAINNNIKDQAEPSEQSIQTFKEVRACLTPQILKLDVTLVQAYQNAEANSAQHKLRLLEITAAALHTFAGAIYGAVHPEMNLKPEPSLSYSTEGCKESSFVELYHTSYRSDYARYPHGLLNVVGYWAETQFFGGVLLFERERSGSERGAAFLHPQNLRPFELSQQQIDEFVELGERKVAGTKFVLEPTLPFSRRPNAKVVSTLEAHSMNIYKNQYDREQIPTWPLNGFSHCVRTVPNHLEPSAIADEYSKNTRQRILQWETTTGLSAVQQVTTKDADREINFQVNVGMDS